MSCVKELNVESFLFKIKRVIEARTAIVCQCMIFTAFKNKYKIHVTLIQNFPIYIVFILDLYSNEETEYVSAHTNVLAACT